MHKMLSVAAYMKLQKARKEAKKADGRLVDCFWAGTIGGHISQQIHQAGAVCYERSSKETKHAKIRMALLNVQGSISGLAQGTAGPERKQASALLSKITSLRKKSEIKLEDINRVSLAALKYARTLRVICVKKPVK